MTGPITIPGHNVDLTKILGPHANLTPWMAHLELLDNSSLYKAFIEVAPGVGTGAEPLWFVTRAHDWMWEASAVHDFWYSHEWLAEAIAGKQARAIIDTQWEKHARGLTGGLQERERQFIIARTMLRWTGKFYWKP